MADLNANLLIRTLTVQANTWLTVSAPVSCVEVKVQNPDAVNALLMRSDVGDATTQRTVPAASEVNLRASGLSMAGPLFVLQFANGVTGPVNLTFIR